MVRELLGAYYIVNCNGEFRKLFLDGEGWFPYNDYDWETHLSNWVIVGRYFYSKSGKEENPKVREH